MDEYPYVLDVAAPGWRVRRIKGRLFRSFLRLRCVVAVGLYQIGALGRGRAFHCEMDASLGEYTRPLL